MPWLGWVIVGARLAVPFFPDAGGASPTPTTSFSGKASLAPTSASGGASRARTSARENGCQRMESRQAMAFSKIAGDLSDGTIGRIEKLKNIDQGAVASRITSAEFASAMAMPPLASA